ncbi:hypothetical protein KUTeg_015588 [Tegillarca granosa]|uniref:RUN domain-containing protein n=1 Tax=Tegillarca granosa TaxID=220873 RepID=A0ABQ9EQK6_TEGGR|nr:hypothetical protein KUTeg_015588 [Tegillarca granosa]
MFETDLKRRLIQRQVNVQRKNLVQVCRFSVKTLIDKSSLANVDDDCEELINFCAVLEHVLSHNIKVHKAWYRSGEPRQFWDYIQLACKSVPHSCIHSISTLENVKSSLAKGRAWIRCVLMEKRLSEYLSEALKETKITSFCLKGENLELSSPVAIDYTPYLRFHQSHESLQSDKEELQGLNANIGQSSSIMCGEDSMMQIEANTWEQKYKTLEQKYRVVNEQKGYLEELSRTRGMNLQEAQRQRQTLMKNLTEFESNSRKERHQLEQVIIELQHQMSKLKQQHEIQQKKYSEMMKQLRGGHMSMDEVAGVRATSPQPWQQQPAGSTPDSDQASSSSNEGSSSMPESAAKLAIKSVGQFGRTDDSGSTTAMAGSFSSEVSVRDIHSDISDMDKKSKEFQEKYMQSKSNQNLPQKRQEQRLENIRKEEFPEVMVTVATPEAESPVSEKNSQPLSDSQVDMDTISDSQFSKAMTDSDISDGGHSSKSSESELKDFVVLDTNSENNTANIEDKNEEQVEQSRDSTPEITVEQGTGTFEVEENGNNVEPVPSENQVQDSKGTENLE